MGGESFQQRRRLILSHATPRIAFIDIETSPLVIAAWQLYDTNAVYVIRDSYIISFAVSWEGDRKTKCHILPDFPLYKKEPHNDRELVKELHGVLDAADIVIAHHGDGFDIPKINARLIIHGHKPPSPYKTVDTLKLSKIAKFDSHKLDNIARQTTGERKIVTTGGDLWKRCTGDSYDEEAWETMRRYNKRDVRILKPVYEILRPWAKNHPDLRLYTQRDHCPTCMSSHVKLRGLNYSKSIVRQRWLCSDCGKSYSGEIVYGTTRPQRRRRRAGR